MQTMHEFMMTTKALEFLLALGLAAVFVVFWRFLNAERKAQ
jgi:hypothetical protein